MTKCPTSDREVPTPLFLDLDGWAHLSCALDLPMVYLRLGQKTHLRLQNISLQPEFSNYMDRQIEPSHKI